MDLLGQGDGLVDERLIRQIPQGVAGGEGNAGNIPAEAVQEAVQAGRDHLGGAGALIPVGSRELPDDGQ